MRSGGQQESAWTSMSRVWRRNVLGSLGIKSKNEDPVLPNTLTTRRSTDFTQTRPGGPRPSSRLQRVLIVLAVSLLCLGAAIFGLVLQRSATLDRVLRAAAQEVQQKRAVHIHKLLKSDPEGKVVPLSRRQELHSFLPVLIPVCGRPDYFREVIDAVLAADGIGETAVVVSDDCGHPEVGAIIRNASASGIVPVIHMRHTPPYYNLPSKFIRTDMPTAANVHFLLSLAFDHLPRELVPAAVMLESDVKPSPDFYRYFFWAYQAVNASPTLSRRVFNVNGFQERSAKPKAVSEVPGAEDPRLFEFTVDSKGFAVWGWLALRQSWGLMRRHWTRFHNWDITVEHDIRRTHRELELAAPVFSSREVAARHGTGGDAERMRAAERKVVELMPIEQLVQEAEGLVSLSPVVSRMRHIGLQGINFSVDAADRRETERWLQLYVPPKPVDYANRRPRLVRSPPSAVGVGYDGRDVPSYATTEKLGGLLLRYQEADQKVGWKRRYTKG